ncbi:MAG: hypothetical protein NZM15_03695 [Flavobacteriales bacterium]|nr:hypothetical protein [Flavobacteriales bacterium]MDW8431789.1 hypothetical protein [Flavobacteriales bacterium]
MRFSFLLTVFLIGPGSLSLTSRAQSRVLVQGCNRCPGGLRLEFPAEYLAFSLDSALTCPPRETYEWNFFTKDTIPARLRCGALYQTFILHSAALIQIAYLNPEVGFDIQVIDPLNQKLRKIILGFDSLYLNQMDQIRMGKALELARDFESAWTPLVQDEPFLREFLRYSLAHFFLATGTLSKNELYRRYLDQKPILWKNEAYGQFFRDFFEDALVEALTRRRYQNLEHWLKSGGSWKAVDSAVATLSYMSDSLLRYPALALALVKLSTEKVWKDKPLYLYLTELKKYLPEQPAAEHFWKTCHDRLHPPPSEIFEQFTQAALIGPENKKTTLSALSDGRPLLIYFLDPSAPSVLEEILLLQGLEKSLKNKIQIILVFLGYMPQIQREVEKISSGKWAVLRPESFDLLKWMSRGRERFWALYDGALRFLTEDLPPLQGPVEEALKTRLKLH